MFIVILFVADENSLLVWYGLNKHYRQQLFKNINLCIIKVVFYKIIYLL